MKPILLGTSVDCADGRAGRVRAIVLDPVAKRVSMLVVDVPTGLSHRSVLVPISKVARTTAEHVELLMTRGELSAMDPYTSERYVQTMLHDEMIASASGLSTTFPALVTEVVEDKVHDALTPPGHLVFGPGCDVFATDGKAGIVAGFWTDDADAALAKLVVGHGHLWRRSQTAVSMNAVAAIEGDTVHLSLSKADLDAVSGD